jgi:hypothetical protein
MVQVQCPFCRRRSSRIFEHLAVSHDIGSPEELSHRTQTKERADQEAADFSVYSETLKAQMAAGKITGEEYGRLIIAWATSHPKPEVPQ